MACSNENTRNADSLENLQRNGCETERENLSSVSSFHESLPQVFVFAHTVNIVAGEQMRLFDMQDAMAERKKGVANMNAAREWVENNQKCWQLFSKKLHSICKTHNRAPSLALAWASLECSASEGRVIEWNNDILPALVRLYLKDHPADIPHIETRRASVDGLGGAA